MNQTTTRLPEAFRGMRALVLGDAMLDSYHVGASRRLCQEAPVPIVDVQQRRVMPGGAGNCAANLATLEATSFLLGVIGADAEGEELRRLLEHSGVQFDIRSICPQRRTLAKSRIVCEQQLVVRFDQGSTESISAREERSLLERLDALYPQMDAVIVSDYGYGVLTRAVIERLATLQKTYGKVLAVDSKNLAAYRDVGMTACKPNFRETTQMLEGEIPSNGNRTSWLLEHGPRLLDKTGARIVAVTLDSDGAIVFQRGAEPYRTFARGAPSHRAAGAGDTFLCALALSLAGGASVVLAAELASTAASLAVSKEYTATCSLDELLRANAAELCPDEDIGRLAQLVAEHRSHGRRIVLTNGCFDILHRGHVAYLEQAKRLGDVLVVGVNSDAGIRRLKGVGRPINQLRDRVEVLGALGCVDHVVAFDEDTPCRLIEIVRPDVFAKGGDYTREQLPEAALVERLGGVVKILPYILRQSTTGIINRICRMENGQQHNGDMSCERLNHVLQTMGNGETPAVHQA